MNKSGEISRPMIRAIRHIFFIGGFFVAAGPCLMTEDVNENKLCKIRVQRIVLVPASIFDIFIFILSSWLFIRPLMRSLKRVKIKWIQHTVIKEAVCVTISLLSTVIALLAVGLLDGIVNIAVGLDSTITTCCLVAIATPVRENVDESICCFKRLYLRLCCLGRERKLEKARAILEEISPEPPRENSCSHWNTSTKQLTKEEGSWKISHISRKSEGTVPVSRESPQRAHNSKRISVQWELRDIHDEELSTSSSYGSMKYPQIKSVSMYSLKEREELRKIYRDICGEEVDI